MWRICDGKGWANTIAVKFHPSVWWNSVIRGPARAQRSAEDVGMRRCYCINTTALLTPGSYFLRRNPRWFRGLFYSNRSGVRHASLTPHSTPLCSFPPLSLSVSFLHRHPGFSLLILGRSHSWHVLGSIFTSTTGPAVRPRRVRRSDVLLY